VVALTPGSKRSLAARTRIRRSCVIPNAPDLTVPRGVMSSGRNRLILFLGHLYRDKGVYELLDAFARLQPARPGLRLVLAGEGPEAHGLRLQANRLRLNATVELPGWVGPEAKAALLAKAACLALPSHDEGLPLALLEAMLAGVPVVATSVGGVPEIVEDGRHALLVAPHDPDSLATALARVLDDPVLATRLSEAARRLSRAEYTPDRLAERVSALYREVLASR
jgi:glycosyltransferase involved in cell wall biosynthesis